jgi:hypothetical protein
MQRQIELLDVVALLTDLPERGLVQGQVSAVVERLADDVFEIELCDDEGKTSAECAVEG